MRIVSQKRDYSVDFQHAPFWTQSNIIYAKIGNESVMFGMYESNDRAAEVFEDIHKAYGPVGLISTNLTREQVEQFVGSPNVPIKCVEMAENSEITMFDSIVYYMPEV